MVRTLVGGRRCVTSWCDLDLTFHLVVVTGPLISCAGYISATVRYRKLILGRDIGWGL